MFIIHNLISLFKWSWFYNIINKIIIYISLQYGYLISLIKKKMYRLLEDTW